MALHGRLLTVLLLVGALCLLPACTLIAADAGVLLGSDLGVAQQVGQVQKKLHDVQEKLEAAESRGEALEKHAEAIESELKASKESAEAELASLRERKTSEVESTSSKLDKALARIQALEEEVATLSSAKAELETERSKLLKLATDGEKAKQAEKRAKELEEENKKQLKRAENAERGEAAQVEAVRQLRKEVGDLRKQATEAADKISTLEAALLQAQAELSAKEKVLSSWLPPWAAAKFEEAILVRWFKHGHPVAQEVSKRVVSTANTAHQWAKPHIDRAYSVSKRTWDTVGQPGMEYAQAKQQRLFSTLSSEWSEHMTPVVENVHKRAATAYQQAASVVGPHAARAKRGLAASMDTLMQHPHYLALSSAAAPYLYKVHELLRPGMDAAKWAWGAIMDLHDQAVQLTLEQLSSNSITSAYATLKNARVVLYIILALPAVVILASSSALSKRLQFKSSTSSERLAKKRRKMVPGKPGSGAGTLGSRLHGTTSGNGTGTQS